METTQSTNGTTSITNDPAPPPNASIVPIQQLSTHAIHADDHLNPTTDVSPALHVSTTFRYSSTPSSLIPASHLPTLNSSSSHIYSRETAPNSTRLETVLTPLLHAPCVTYSSGLSALHALYVFLNPARVSIGGGYHGSHGVLGLHAKLTGATILPLECVESELKEGDVVHLETPVNPTGEAFSIAKYAEKAHARGAFLLVDATFGPPGLQDPFAWGADVVMHSGTKYLGGHSDMLCGVLASNRAGWVEGLKRERTYLGSVMGSMEGWLGLRSVRTLGVRVERQSANAERLVGWVEGERGRGKEGAVARTVESVWHASLQKDEMSWLREQMPNGFGPVFALTMKSEHLAKCLPSKLELFHHATSLGGVESLVEWRAMSDATVDTRIVRVSVGIEHWEDLRDDLARAFEALVEDENGDA